MQDGEIISDKCFNSKALTNKELNKNDICKETEKQLSITGNMP